MARLPATEQALWGVEMGRNGVIAAEKIAISAGIPTPAPGELPTHYADRVGTWYVGQKSAEHRKSHGLYLTPVAVAAFMADQIQAAGNVLRLLDPAAGGGILLCAAVEALLNHQTRPQSIELTAYEVDLEQLPSLEASLGYLKSWANAVYGVSVTLRIIAQDFIMEHAEALALLGSVLPYSKGSNGFDIVIANPPYFKISKADPRATAAAAVVHGQPNIYGLFMAVCAALLRHGGDFIFITPRSFASGPYFKLFREKFFNVIRPVEVHVFGSRREAFSRDEILQENIIFSGTRDDAWATRSNSHSLAVSSSQGASDIGQANRRRVALTHALDLRTCDKVLRLPVTDEDDEVIRLVESWPGSLMAYGFNISTGPVVPFRAREVIDKSGAVPTTHVPLLWMNHVKPMQVSWPLARHKPEFIKLENADPLLVANRNYVLLRRFSAKEEARRLTAAPYLARDYDVPVVGLENHLNYVHKPKGNMSEEEAIGLAALYSSALLDTYFRCINGNTQVSATELRAIPLPPREVIVAIGQQIKNGKCRINQIDGLVMEMVSVDTLSRKEMAFG